MPERVKYGRKFQLSARICENMNEWQLMKVIKAVAIITVTRANRVILVCNLSGYGLLTSVNGLCNKS